MVHEWSALHPLRQEYATLFTTDTDTMRSFSKFAQKDHMQAFDFILDCHDFLKISPGSGKCDQTCWLSKAL